MDRMIHILLIGFAALVGSFEGPAQIICILAIIACFAGGKFKTYRPSYIEFGLLLWLLAGVPALIIGNPGDGTEGILRPLISLAFFIGCVGITGANEKTVNRMGLAFAIACIINGLYGYIQVFIADPPLEMFLARRLRSQHLIDPENQAQLKMATGLFYNRLKLAHVGIVGLGLLGILATEQDKKRLWSITGALLLAGAIFLTYRRAAPIALILAGALLALIIGRSRIAISSLVAGAVVVALFLMTDYGRERVAGLSENLTERLSIYKSAFLIIKENFWFGVGHGQYQQAILQVAPSMPRDLTTSPHNLALHVFTETGFIGLIGFCVGVVGACTRLIRGINRSGAVIRTNKILDHFALLGLACLLILGLVHSVLHHVPVSLLFWTLIGVASTRGQNLNEPVES